MSKVQASLERIQSEVQAVLGELSASDYDSEALAKLKVELELKKSSLKLRFEEIAKLTQLIMSQDAELVELKANLSKERKALKSLKAEHKDLERAHKIAIKNRKRAEAERDELIAQNSVLSKGILEPVNNVGIVEDREKELRNLSSESVFTSHSLSEGIQTINSKVTFEQNDNTKILVLDEISDLYENLQEQVSFIRESGLFDANWYLSSYPDVAQANIDPLEHFVKYGWLEDRSPSAEFDVPWYLSEYKDVAEANLNPLVHYICFGKAEGRLPSGNLKYLMGF